MSVKREPVVLLSVRFSRPEGPGTLTWWRSYLDSGFLVEVVTYTASTGLIGKEERRLFAHWFFRRDMAGIQKDYRRWDWEVLEYNVWPSRSS